MMIESYGYGPGPLAASAAVPAKELQGVFCSDSTGGTLVVYDGASASGTQVIASLALVAGTFYRMPFRSLTGSFYFAIGGTTHITVAVG